MIVIRTHRGKATWGEHYTGRRILEEYQRNEGKEGGRERKRDRQTERQTERKKERNKRRYQTYEKRTGYYLKKDIPRTNKNF